MHIISTTPDGVVTIAIATEGEMNSVLKSLLDRRHRRVHIQVDEGQHRYVANREPVDQPSVNNGGTCWRLYQLPAMSQHGRQLAERILNSLSEGAPVDEILSLLMETCSVSGGEMRDLGRKLVNAFRLREVPGMR
jgi:hypothetical protein